MSGNTGFSNIYTPCKTFNYCNSVSAFFLTFFYEYLPRFWALFNKQIAFE